MQNKLLTISIIGILLLGFLTIFPSTTAFLYDDWSISYDSSLPQIRSLAIYNDKLYAGGGAPAKVCVFDGSTWCVSYDGSQSHINSLAVYNGKLYAGSEPSGIVYVFDGNDWNESYVSSLSNIYSLAVYNGKLYAGGGQLAKVYVFDGSTWNTSYDSPETYIHSLTEYNGKLYAGSEPSGIVYVFDGNDWNESYDSSESHIDSLAVYNGKLYAGSGSNGLIYVFDGNIWNESYDSSENHIESLAVYNGKLYVGSSSNGLIYVFDGNIWNESYDSSESHIDSLAVYNGKLYAGGGSSIGLIYVCEEIQNTPPCIHTTYGVFPSYNASNNGYYSRLSPNDINASKICELMGVGITGYYLYYKTNVTDSWSEYIYGISLDIIIPSGTYYLIYISPENFTTTLIGKNVYGGFLIIDDDNDLVRVDVQSYNEITELYDGEVFCAGGDIVSGEVLSFTLNQLPLPNHLYKYRIMLDDGICPIVYYYYNFTIRASYDISHINPYPNNQTNIPIDNLVFSTTIINPDYLLDSSVMYITTLELLGQTSINPLPHASDFILIIENGINNTTYSINFSHALNFSTQYDYIILMADDFINTSNPNYYSLMEFYLWDYTFTTQSEPSENAMPVFEHAIPRVESDGYLYMIYRNGNINVSNLNLLMGNYANFSVWKFNYTSQDWDSNNFIINSNDYIKIKIDESDMPYNDTLISIIPQLRFKITDADVDDKLNIILTSNSTGVWSVITQWINVSQGWFSCNDSNMNEYNTTYYYKLDVMDSYGNIVISNFSFITTSTEPAIPPIISDINLYIISILVLVGIGGGVYILSPKKRKR